LSVEQRSVAGAPDAAPALRWERGAAAAAVVCRPTTITDDHHGQPDHAF